MYNVQYTLITQYTIRSTQNTKHNAIQCNTIQYNTIQYNTIHTLHTLQYIALHYTTVHHSASQYNTLDIHSHTCCMDILRHT